MQTIYDVEAHQAVVSMTMTAQPEEKLFAYFVGIQVENILCFKDKQTLTLSNTKDVPAQWTVILGDNGTGKTTLLRCLAGMSVTPNVYEAISPQRPKMIFGKSGFDKRYDSSIRDCPTFEQLEYGLNTIYAEFLLQPKLNSFTITDSQQGYGNKLKTRKIFGLGPDGEGSCDYPESFIDSTCYGYGAHRIARPSSFTEEFQDAAYATLFSNKAFLINAEEWLLQADYSRKSSTGLQQQKISNKLEKIKQVFINSLPDIEGFDFFFDEQIHDRPVIKFETPYGWSRLSDLGLGYQTMIVWLLDLIIRLYERYPDSEDPLAEPAIVLVDEIDLHLHPKWQRQIMSFLTERFPNTQFVVTAHSPLVVQASQDANIVLLRREGDRVFIDNNPEIVSNWRVDQLLTSLFEIPSARPAKLDPHIEEREAILAKPHLTDSDQQRLEELREIMGSFPSGERPEERQAMDIIRRAAKLIEEQNKHDSDS